MMRLPNILPLLLTAAILPSSAHAYTRMKTEVATGGIYEISHEALREAGFTNPEAVGIEGPEGPVGVLHHEGRMTVWLEGVESFTFLTDNSPAGGRFINNGRNPYSRKLTYILTDDPEKLRIIPDETDSAMTLSEGESDTATAGYGVALLSHEIDLYQNNTASGTLFWGEELNHGAPSRYEWNVDLKGRSDIPATMTANFYIYSKKEGNLSIGLTPGDRLTHKIDSLKPVYHTPLTLTKEMTVATGNTTVSVDYETSAPYSGIANLDFWTLSYPHDIVPFSSEESALDDSSALLHSPFMALPEGAGRESVRFPVADSTTALLDITDPLNAVLYRSNGGNISLRCTGAAPVVTLFDISATQQPLRISGVVDSDSEALSEIGTRGGDLLILTPSWLKEKGEEIAAIHRENDGMEVAVVDPAAIYDAYTASNPEPDAVRRFIKEMRKSEAHPLRNVLLLGPIAADMHDVNPDSVIIAPQASRVHNERGAYTALAYYVSDEDNRSDEWLMRDGITCGIGHIPATTLEEADLYIDKIRRYIANPTTYSQLGNLLWIGGEGDKHTHVQQTIDLATLLTTESNGRVMNSLIPIDGYGFEEARRRMFTLLDEGMAFTTYIGHADPAMLGKMNNGFLSPAHILSLRNEPLTFLITAGCSATGTDKGVRGIGEHMIMSTAHGAVGGLVTTRETWSAQNKNFLSRFFKGVYANPGKTIGEIFASTQREILDVNELSFILMCDPALKLPTASLNITGELTGSIRPGAAAVVEGRIKDNDGTLMPDFNGKIMARITAPTVTYNCGTITSGIPNAPDKRIEMNDLVIAGGTGEVKDGVFSIELPMPESTSIYTGQKLNIYLTAFDEVLFKGAGGYISNVKLENGSAEDPSGSDDSRDDRSAPIIEALRYEYGDNKIVAEISDDRILDLYGTTGVLSVSVDGCQITSNSKGTVDEIADGGKWCRVRVALPTLSDGEHSVVAEVRDAKGNVTFTERVITVGVPGTPLTLSLEQTAVVDKADFIIESADNTELILLNSAGDVVRRMKAEGNHIHWDRRDNDGNRVPEGRYKAYLRQESPDGTLTYSPYVPLLLLDL